MFSTFICVLMFAFGSLYRMQIFLTRSFYEKSPGFNIDGNGVIGV
ncbi:hypothetical protein MHA_0981 [Mannheimia haemolytica PHL213]|nr:hypothetical protein MHA_0981 [Mannheimia haemolytica PHL213]